MKKQVSQAPPPAPPEAPDHLSERSKTLWRAVVPSRISAGRAALLQVGLEALDRADAAKALLDQEGLVLQGRGMPHAHPACRIERDSRALFARVWADLRLGWDGDIDGVRG